MLGYDKPYQRLAICLAALAGFVDAIGFLGSGGLFVSFMSGNTTRMAIGIAAATTVGFTAAALVALFVAGVVLNVIAAERITRVHRKVVAISVVAVMLIAATICKWFGAGTTTTALLCLAMGASNAIFRRDGEVSIGVTYMTGNLVKLGHRLADAALGGSRTAFVPYLLLWLALVVGGIMGAAAYVWSDVAAIAAAALLAAALIPLTARLTAGTAA